MRSALIAGSPITITNADVFSSPLNINQDIGFCAVATFTGASLTGTAILQASVDYNTVTGNTGTWVDITGTGQSVSGPGSVVWNYDGAYFQYTRVHFVYGSNSGTMTVNSGVKGV